MERRTFLKSLVAGITSLGLPAFNIKASETQSPDEIALYEVQDTMRSLGEEEITVIKMLGQPDSFIQIYAGEKIYAGDLVSIGTDGKVYQYDPKANREPIGIGTGLSDFQIG